MNRAQKSMEDRDRHMETIRVPLWANPTSSKPLLLAGFFLRTHSSPAGLRYIYLAYIGMSGCALPHAGRNPASFHYG